MQHMSIDSESGPQPHLRGGGSTNQDVTKRGNQHSGGSSNGKPSTVRDFAKYLINCKCKCGAPYIKGQSDVEALFKKWQYSKTKPSSILNCKSCASEECISCRSQSSATHVEVKGLGISWCCNSGRLFLIWTILCGFDTIFCGEKQQQASITGTRQNQYFSYDKGIGYGGTGTDGIGFGSNMRLVKEDPTTKAAKKKALTAEQMTDSAYMALFAILERLLPSMNRRTEFDIQPNEVVTEMLLDSKILDYCAELLRNDSLDNCNKRHELYHVLLSFLRTVGTHPVTSRVIFSERPLKPDSMNIVTLSFQRVHRPNRRETSKPLASGLRSLNTQSSLMMRGAKMNKADFQDNEGKQLMALCQRIIKLSEDLLKNTEDGLYNDHNGAVDHGIIDAPDESILEYYRFKDNAKSMNYSQPGRMKRLITEHTSLMTDLPAGIFVKYACSRIDVIKFIIIGPEGTPYENGLFEFDLLCPSEYPNVPPLCYFRWPGGRVAHLNANIHPDGKVCLSLLNTWPGEPWRPGVSTLLQVLISIQAMIFCENPNANQPGDEGRVGVTNWPYQEATVRVGLLPWLESPPSLWKDVIKLHFKANANRIIRKVEQWTAETSRFVGSSVYTYLNNLAIGLQRYGATYVPTRYQQIQNNQRANPFDISSSRGSHHRFPGPGRHF
ncbi:hypothetical protein BS50DRAFT_681303 [Corynespora cassiicola Philippines]|uniref:UBC core domain-containing protein n=1 Tax=Corynespora cassiicola Philippines TaxID=1448308 RepID=A0A2T2N5Q3_CORCC|nr:hypothetical protein BS50DRAFT_681303 [Corynespora cassiicola Philippines]